VARDANVDVTEDDETALVHGWSPSSLRGSLDMKKPTPIAKADAGASPALSSNFAFQVGCGQESFRFRHREDQILPSPYVSQEILGLTNTYGRQYLAHLY
jgi:hypothetical protein